MKKRGLLSIILAISMVLSLCACGGGRSSGADSYSIPSWVSERKNTSSAEDGTGSVPVNFYYDNTAGMYPFVCNEDGESNVDGKAVVSGPLVSWISAIRELLQNTNGTAYTLQTDEDNMLSWTVYDGDIHNNFSNKSFYTFHGYLDVDGDAQVGPLAQIYYGDTMDTSAVNLVLTDLAEQSVNNTELAACINRTILSQKDYGVAIIAVECEFNGKAYVPDPNKVSTLLKSNVYDERPLYMILTGPNEQLESVYNTLISCMEQYGMEEDDDFYAVLQSSDTTVSAVSDQDIVVAGELAESDNKDFKGYITNSIFYDNFGLSLYTESETAELFGSNDYLKEAINAFQSENAKRMVLNYYIPIQDYDNFGESYIWRVATSLDEETKDAGGSDEVSELLANKDYIQYDYIVSSEVEVSAEDSAEASAETETSGRRGRSRSSSRSKTTTETVYSWYCDDGGETTLKNFNDTFTLTAEQIDFAPEDDHTLAGAELYDKNGDSVITDGSAGRGQNSYELDSSDVVDLSAADHWIHLQIEGNGSYDSSTVAFDIPIYAYVSSTSQLPEWVSELNATAEDSSSPEYYTHTFNLTGFYSTLFGVNTGESESVYQARREIKIADVVTVITDLSTGKSR